MVNRAPSLPAPSYLPSYLPTFLPSFYYSVCALSIQLIPFKCEIWLLGLRNETQEAFGGNWIPWHSYNSRIDRAHWPHRTWSRFLIGKLNPSFHYPKERIDINIFCDDLCPYLKLLTWIPGLEKSDSSMNKSSVQKWIKMWHRFWYHDIPDEQKFDLIEWI